MSKRSRRGQHKTVQDLPLEELVLEERQVPAAFDLHAPLGPDKPLPLRLLSNFVIYKGDPEHGEVAKLEDIANGDASGVSFSATGMLVDHDSASESLSQAQKAAYASIRIPTILDWVIDSGPQFALWIITPVAWYRLLNPANIYAQPYQDSLVTTQLAQSLVQIICSDPEITLLNAIEKLELVTLFEILRHRGPVEKAVKNYSGFLAKYLARHLGRHVLHCPLVKDLAQNAHLDVSNIQVHSMPLVEWGGQGQIPNPNLRPVPRKDTKLPGSMHSRLLVIWDFCQNFRQFLRLPPFPPERLEAAFVEMSIPLHNQNGSDSSQNKQSLEENILLRDIHLAMLRILEGIDVTIMELATLAGFGSASDLGPSDVYKPLLGVTWPELVRQKLLTFLSDSSHPASIAIQKLRVTEYHDMTNEEHLSILEALMWAVTDSETFREHLQEDDPDTMSHLFSRGEAFGRDSSGAVYYRLGSSTGMNRLFVDLRGQDGLQNEPSNFNFLGWYEIEDLQGLINWLDTGNSEDCEFAELLYQEFCTQIMAHTRGEKSGLEAQDGYETIAGSVNPISTLRREILSIFEAVRFWEKGVEWLQAQAAVQAEIVKASTGKHFAKLVWLVEDLAYTDLLKGTGWGRKRAWCKDLLEKCVTLAQVAVVVCQMAVHKRSAEDLGFMSITEFKEALSQASAQPNFIPSQGKNAVLLSSGYIAHIQQANPPKDALSSPIPKHWKFAENVQVKDVKFVHGNWQRPSWQGRFVSGPTAPYSSADDLLVACLLLEKSSDVFTNSDQSSSDEIDWEEFNFQSGFRDHHEQSAAENPTAKLTDSIVDFRQPKKLKTESSEPNLLDAQNDIKANSNTQKSQNPNLEIESLGINSNSIANNDKLLNEGSQPVRRLDSFPALGNNIEVEAFPKNDSTENKRTEDQLLQSKGGELEGIKVQEDHLISEQPRYLPNGDLKSNFAPSPQSTRVSKVQQENPNLTFYLNNSETPGQIALSNNSGHPQTQTQSQPSEQRHPTMRNVDANPSSHTMIPTNPIMSMLVENKMQNAVGRANSQFTSQVAKPYGSHPGQLQSLSSTFNFQTGSFRPLSVPVPVTQASSKGSTYTGPQGVSNLSVTGRSESFSNLRRSGRTRTEVSRPDYAENVEDEAMGSAQAAPVFVASRSRRGTASDLFQLGHRGTILSAPNKVMKPQSLAQYVASSVDAEHEFEGERGGLTIKFWKKNRELAAVNFYIRKRGLASVEFLVNPQLYATGMQRSWSEGTIIKMPAFANIARAMAIPSMKWYSGVVSVTYSPPSDLQKLPGITVEASQKAAETGAPSQKRSEDIGRRVQTSQPQTEDQMATQGDTSKMGIQSNSYNAVGSSQAIETTTVHPMPKAQGLVLQSNIQPGQGNIGANSTASTPQNGFIATNSNSIASNSTRQSARLGGTYSNTNIPNGISQPMQNQSTGPRLSSLVPRMGNWSSPIASQHFHTTAGGLQGMSDPWKALWIRWDPGTPINASIRVSPWEVLEDTNGTVRLANSKGFYPLGVNSSTPSVRPSATYRPMGSLPNLRPPQTSSIRPSQNMSHSSARTHAPLQAHQNGARPASFSALMNQVGFTPPAAPIAFQPNSPLTDKGHHAQGAPNYQTSAADNMAPAQHNQQCKHPAKQHSNQNQAERE